MDPIKQAISQHQPEDFSQIFDRLINTLLAEQDVSIEER